MLASGIDLNSLDLNASRPTGTESQRNTEVASASQFSFDFSSNQDKPNRATEIAPPSVQQQPTAAIVDFPTLPSMNAGSMVAAAQP